MKLYISGDGCQPVDHPYVNVARDIVAQISKVPDGACDEIIMSDALARIAWPEGFQVLAEAVRILTVAGRLIVTVIDTLTYAQLILREEAHQKPLQQIFAGRRFGFTRQMLHDVDAVLGRRASRFQSMT